MINIFILILTVSYPILRRHDEFDVAIWTPAGRFIPDYRGA